MGGNSYHRCPNNGRILKSCDKYDDKVICGCGKTLQTINGGGEAPGLHFKCLIEDATENEYFKQERKGAV